MMSECQIDYRLYQLCILLHLKGCTLKWCWYLRKRKSFLMELHYDTEKVNMVYRFAHKMYMQLRVGS